MKKSDADLKGAIARATPEARLARPSMLARAFGLPSPVASVDGVLVVPLTRALRLAIPPLLVSSLPKRAIGFSFPRGNEGKILGVCLLAATVAASFLSFMAYGLVAALAMVWLIGGTGAVILYNSTRQGIAFVKQMCSSCRLRPIIEEHETMHLNGLRSEEAVWAEARKKYTYEGLGLGTDPNVHSFCPIAKKLKESP